METQMVRTVEELKHWRIVPPQGDGAGRAYLQRFVVRLGSRIVFVRAEEVDWIQSAANYVRLHVGSNAYTIRETMATTELMLDPARFQRIHRNAIINLNSVEHFESSEQGSMTAVMRSGLRLPISRSYRTAMRRILRQGI